jgi:hypothetical protein
MFLSSQIKLKKNQSTQLDFHASFLPVLRVLHTTSFHFFFLCGALFFFFFFLAFSDIFLSNQINLKDKTNEDSEEANHFISFHFGIELIQAGGDAAPKNGGKGGKK